MSKIPCRSKSEFLLFQGEIRFMTDGTRETEITVLSVHGEMR